MAHLITFATGKFDISKETPNDINPIAGEGVLKWIQHHLASAGFDSTEPSTEDWGWYMIVEGSGGSYLVGASGEADRPPPDVDWIIQVHKRRSLMDKLTGKNKLSNGDPLVALLERLVRGEPDFRVSPGVAKFPKIEAVAGRLRYLDVADSWDIAIADIGVVGEFTNQSGPGCDDYFLAFVEHGSLGWYEASFYAEGRDEVLKALSLHFGTGLECQLCTSTDFRSRVMWPPALADRELFQWTPMPFRLSVSQQLHPQVRAAMTPNKSLERTRGE